MPVTPEKPLALVFPDPLHHHALIRPHFHKRRVLLISRSAGRAARLVSWKLSTTAFSPRIDLLDAGLPAQQLQRHDFSRNSASGGVVPKAVDHSAAKASISAWLASAPMRR